MTEFLALKMYPFTPIHLSAFISVPMDMAVETKALFIGALFMVVSIFSIYGFRQFMPVF